MRYFMAPLTALIMINILHDISLQPLMASLLVFEDFLSRLHAASGFREEIKTQQPDDLPFVFCWRRRSFDQKKVEKIDENLLTRRDALAPERLSFRFEHWFPIKIYSRINQWRFWISSGWFQSRNRLTLHFFWGITEMKTTIKRCSINIGSAFASLFFGGCEVVFFQLAFSCSRLHK